MKNRACLRFSGIEEEITNSGDEKDARNGLFALERPHWHLERAIVSFAKDPSPRAAVSMGDDASDRPLGAADSRHILTCFRAARLALKIAAALAD